MKNLLFTCFCALLTGVAVAGTSAKTSLSATRFADTVKLQIDSDKNVYYQKIVTVANNLTVDMIYNRAIQFMSAKNIQQNYGYEQDGRLIFTTSQDLNVNPVYVGDDNDGVEPYTVQFAIILDVKHGVYRYTINNITIFHPVMGFNKRETLLDLTIKANNTDAKRVARGAKAVIASLERYLGTFTQELRMGIEQKAVMYSKF